MSETTQDTAEANTIGLGDFLEEFGSGLLDAVSRQNPPVYTAPDERRAAIMDGLLRAPYPEQAECVQALLALLLDQGERAGILNAEMGTGKTIMGIATASVLHAEGYPRTLVLSPPHLVYKWRREILETVPDAEVWVLNGPDTLVKLIMILESIRGGVRPDKPVFFILGRVRARMGFHWRPVAVPAKRYTRETVTVDDEGNTEDRINVVAEAACPDCGEVVHKEMEGGIKVRVLHQAFIEGSKRQTCAGCGAALWTLHHRMEGDADPRERVASSLKKLPTIGPKWAEKLIGVFGHEKLQGLLVDNVYEFINLMDEEGELIFSDRQAARMERAFAKLEFSWGQGSFQPTEFIKRYLPRGTFGLCLIDEGHEYKAANSAQGAAMAVLATQCQKTVLLTGTLMGGYADDLFYLLWRLNTRRFIEDGYLVNSRRSLGTAATSFMKHHGVLEEIIKERHDEDFKSSRGMKKSTNVKRAPGFGPEGIARYVLPYTAFLKLADIGGDVLPPYKEHYVPVTMEPMQASNYACLQEELKQALKDALKEGDFKLLGVVLNVLLRRPDTCFREEDVRHPEDRSRVAYAAPDFGEADILPKEEELVRICREAKGQGRKVLVYTIYTGAHDLGRRTAGILEDAGFKTAVLRASVPAGEREDWIADRVDEIDVLVCNPELVKTGLDLLEFPTIVFMQTGFSVFTLQQASRRSWRIGQKEAVDVFFLGYEETAQIDCLTLMAAKISVAMSTSGTMPETGLDVLNQDSDSVEVALAKKLI